MTAHDRELLRPEDATSLEEFQARRIVEQAQIRGMHSSWKEIGRILLSSVIVLIDIFFWYAMAKQSGPGRWAYPRPWYRSRKPDCSVRWLPSASTRPTLTWPRSSPRRSLTTSPWSRTA